MTEQSVSYRYAKAVIDSAQTESITDTLYQDFLQVEQMLNISHDLRTYIKSPVVPELKKLRIMNEIFDSRISDVTMRFLRFLVMKGRGELIIDIIAQYEMLYNKLNNKLKIEVTTALELNESIKAGLISKITSMTNKEILPEYKVDNSVTGGILVKIDDWVYDATLKNQLENLFKKLSTN